MAPKETKPWRQTPLIESNALSKAAGCRIFLKLENLQPGGSFKSRGIGNLLLNAYKRAQVPSAVHYCSSSGGNAGLACVHAANFIGRPSTVVVPMSTSPEMKEKIQLAGASQVLQFGASWKEADGYLREVVIPEYEARGAECVYVPPFDHPDIWTGHSYMVDELREQFEALGEHAPDVIAMSVGGGGMFCGIMEGLERQKGGWGSNIEILGVETDGAQSLAVCLDSNELIAMPTITSKAVTLGCRQVAKQTFDLATKYRAQGRFTNAIFPDRVAESGCIALADTERILVELACGITVSLCFENRLKQMLGRPIWKDDKIVIIVCGGQGVDTGMIERWRAEHQLQAVKDAAAAKEAKELTFDPVKNDSKENLSLDSGYVSDMSDEHHMKTTEEQKEAISASPAVKKVTWLTN